MKHITLKLTDDQHENLQTIANEYGMSKVKVAILCIDLGCKSIAGVSDLTVKELSGLAKAFEPLTLKINEPEIPEQDLEVKKPE